MNAKQQQVVEKLRRDILAHDGYGDNYEYKRFEVTEHDWAGRLTVQVLSEVGLKNDENTMAQLFCRTRRQIFIGPRGGCRLANAKGRGKKALKTWPRGYWNAVHSLVI